MANDGKGKYTKKLGEQLKNNYKDRYAVFYDHHKGGNLIKAFFGENYSDKTTLSHVDIAFLNKEKKIELLIEVEENCASPKKIIGDLLNITLSDRIHMNHDDYNYAQPLNVIMAIEIKDNKNQENNANKVKELVRMINEINTKMHKDWIKISYVTKLDKIEEEIKKVLLKQ